VIAGEAEAARRPQNQQRRRERQRARPPARLRPEPRVRAVAEEQRRIERREIRTELVVDALEGGPRRVEDESGEREKNREGLDPPEIAPRRLAESAFDQGPRRLRHLCANDTTTASEASPRGRRARGRSA